MLSPHPDDLVFSAFSALTSRSAGKLAIVFFNRSRFTRFGLLPTPVVTFVRTLEDKIILRILGVSSKHLFLRDTTARQFSFRRQDLPLPSMKWRPDRLYCPLGVGDHPDHTAVRDLALDYWVQSGKRSTIHFYEDLPYAARLQDPDREIHRITKTLSNQYGSMTTESSPLTLNALNEKVKFCRLYRTQNDHTTEFIKYAKHVARGSGELYAEQFHSLQDVT